MIESIALVIVIVWFKNAKGMFLMWDLDFILVLWRQIEMQIRLKLQQNLTQQNNAELQIINSCTRNPAQMLRLFLQGVTFKEDNIESKIKCDF